MYSMTGYGKGVAAHGDMTLTVELKTVNHRFLDWGIKLPKNFLFLEEMIKKRVAEEISRGHVDVFVTLEQSAQTEYEYAANVPLARSFLKAAGDLNAALNNVLEDDVTLGYLAKIPDIIVKQQPVVDEEEYEKRLSALTEEALAQALAKLKAMRKREGEALKVDLSRKLDNIEEFLNNIKGYAPSVVKNYRAQLEAHISELVAGAQVDPQRLATEVALFADRCCIDEEITRLTSHISAMRTMLVDPAPVGRKMDFLVQEMNREANTIGSKANNYQITNEVLSLKNEIEKFREQAANVE